MKRGEFGISDIIIFILFVILILGFFAVMSWDRQEATSSIAVHAPSEGFVLTSYLRSPVNADVNADGKVDAKTVIDLVEMGYEGRFAPEARAALKADIEKVRRIMEREGYPAAFRIIYPNGEIVQTQNFEGIPEDTNLVSGKDIFLPLQDGREVRIFFDAIDSSEEDVYGKLGGDLQYERE